MRSIAITISLLLSSLCVLAQQYERVTLTSAGDNVPYETFADEAQTLFNFGWQFTAGNPDGAYKEDYDATTWRTIDLPHDFQFEQPWAEEYGPSRGFKPMCDGWYRKTFYADSLWMGKQVVVDFGGVMYYSDVYVNGELAGAQEYGYCGYEVDISKYLHYGSDNVIAVYANTGKEKACRWYTGGGIYRDVYLKLSNPTHIAREGIYVTTPEVTDDVAQVSVTVDVAGFRGHKTTVRATLYDADNTVVAMSEDTITHLTKHLHEEKTLPMMTVTAPHRWDIDSPYLYSVIVEVEADGIVVDRQSDTFGIRTIEYSPDFGFKLNGRKVFLKGISNHNDYGALGVAAFDRAIERQLRMMKDFGYNALRCSHNPYSASLTKLCDKIGILVVDELIDKWSDDEYWGGRVPFMQLWPELIKEYICRDRNSPSVILWSLGNELQIRDTWSGYNTNDWGITTYNVFNTMVKRYDATRPTTVAMHPSRAGAVREEPEFKTYFAPPELACATEVSAFNYQWDAYPHYFEYQPDMILFQSEAVTNQLVAPFYGMDQARTVGMSYWGAIEYWGESNGWPKKGWNYSFFSHTLQPYPQAYLIRGAFIADEPIVRIAIKESEESMTWNDVNVGQKTYTSFWNCKDGSTVPVTVFTNADEVELLVNGTSLGRQANDTTDVFRRGVVNYPAVAYDHGGTLTAIAYNAGVEVARHEISTADKAVALRLEPEVTDVLHADGMDLIYINIYAVDKAGRQVPTYNEPLTITVDGEATFVAMDNGDHYTNDLFLDVTTKTMRQGYMQVILRTTQQAGKVTLTATTADLKKTMKIETK